MRFIAAYSFPFFAFVIFCDCVAAAPLSNADVVGTFRIAPNFRNTRTIPTNFYPFTLTVNADGSFVATNVPSGVLCEDTAIPEAKGMWKLRHESDGRSLFYTGEEEFLVLNTTFPKASYGELWVRYTWPTMYLQVSYHSGKNDSVTFYLKKEK